MVAAMLQTLGTYYMTNTGGSSTTSAPSGLLLVGFAVLLVFAIVEIIGLWKVFQKAGQPGWAAIVPIYGSWILFEISGKPGWWALTAFLGAIPLVGWIPYLVLYIIAMLELAKYFGKSTAFAVCGMILFPFVGMPMLGFGNDQYNGTPGAAGPTPGVPPAAPPLPPASPPTV